MSYLCLGVEYHIGSEDKGRGEMMKSRGNHPRVCPPQRGLNIYFPNLFKGSTIGVGQQAATLGDLISNLNSRT